MAVEFHTGAVEDDGPEIAQGARVWLAPSESVATPATLTAVSAPRAVALFKFTVPPLTFTTSLALMALAAVLKVKAPESVLVMVRAAPPELSVSTVFVKL